LFKSLVRVFFGLWMVSWGFLNSTPAARDPLQPPSFSPSSKTDGRPNPVRVEALIDNFRVVRGKPFVVRVQLTVNAGFHINSNKPKDKYLIPTEVKLDRISGVLFRDVKFPSAKEAKFQFSSEPLSVFEGEVQLEIPARSLRTLPLGKKVVTGKVIYQACDNDTCYPPRTLPFEIPVDVVQ
jgi:hypothetical protein